MISVSSKYALSLLLELASFEDETYARVLDLARSLRLPAPYIAKIVKRLVKEKILIGRKGPGGGVKLSSLGRKASFYDVCLAVDDPMLEQRCFLSRKSCSEKSPCALHNEWSQVRRNMLSFLKDSKIVKK